MFEIIKEPIVSYLRELGSAEGLVADTRDRKEWKISNLHSRDLKVHIYAQMSLDANVQLNIVILYKTVTFNAFVSQ